MPTFLRKNIGLLSNNYIGKREYFVTFCCHKRQPFLSQNETVLSILDDLKSESTRHSFAIHAYCAMPDHLHFLAAGTSDYSDLLRFVNFFKQKTEHQFHHHTGNQLWQRKFYDHILRRASSVHNVAAYIWMNPVRKNLCASPTEFPYSGSFTESFPLQSATPPSTFKPPWKES
jgi:putative transposase